MKISIMYLFCFLLFGILFLNRPVYSQDTSLSSINNNLVLQRDIKESHLTSMSLGAGTALLSSKKIYTEFLFSGDINVSFNSLIKNTFLLIGFEDYSESKSSINQNRFSIYMIPNYKINIYKDILSLYAGAGLYIYGILTSEGDFAPGFTIFFRGDYKFSERFSCGISLQHPTVGGAEFFSNGLITNNLYISFTL